MDTVHVLRIIEYIGPRDLVEDNIKRAIHGTKVVTCHGGREITIQVTTLGQYPEIMNTEKETV